MPPTNIPSYPNLKDTLAQASKAFDWFLKQHSIDILESDDTICEETNLKEKDIGLWSRIKIKWQKIEFVVIWMLPMPPWMEYATVNWIHTYILVTTDSPYDSDLVKGWSTTRIRSDDIKEVVSRFPYEKIGKWIYKFEWKFLFNKTYVQKLPFDRNSFMEGAKEIEIQKDSIIIQNKKFPKKHFGI